MNSIEKFQTLLILLSVVTGLVLGQFNLFEAHAASFILPFLMLMLYGLFLAVPFKNLKAAFRNRTFLTTSILINFIWTPILAWCLGAVFLSEYPALWLGFILLLVTPCTDWYLIFTAIAKGNMSLATSVLPINLILQVLLLPIYLLLFAGTMESIRLSTVVESVVFVLVIPFLAASFTRYLSKSKEAFLEKKIIPFFASAQLVFLSLAIVAMFASQGSYLIRHLDVIALLLLPLLLFFIINFIVAQTIGKVFKFNYETTASLNLTIIARNSPVALAIVLTAFSDQPLIALALIIGPLIELPVLAIVAQTLLRIRKRKT
ncbi:arsenic resistance protein [Bacillus sp. JCM 19041]|uniref:arsenic resistance protein n=1 Tax=Bacillus sp. JCM 19041 TaxID=1460637 RepID=UPI0006CFD730